jgi:hypothetical protein
MPFIRLVLDSSWVKLANGTYGQPMDGTDYKWNDLTYNLYDFLPPQKITELLLADRYKIMLEDIVWDGREPDIDIPIKIMLPGIMNESTYTNRSSGNDGLLEIIYEKYNPNVYFKISAEKGIVSYDKHWLRSGAMRVRFGTLYSENDTIGNSVLGYTVKYCLTLLIEY